MNAPLLGALTPRAFLARHWQRRPLLVRRALAGFRDPVDWPALVRLATRDDVESRLVRRTGTRWRVAHGPFLRARLPRPAGQQWTLLVSGLNLHVPAAEALLRRFDWLPYARLDDVMVSYAAPGGGVGPHQDSYDVFLLQGRGRRVWRIAPPREYARVPHAPLQLIDGFEPEDELLVEPGDLLYLPPGWAHDGVALEPCLTYSIGFRAPSGSELAGAFLDWLHARGLPERAYRDPPLAPTRHPGRIPYALATHARRTLAGLRWTPGDVLAFTGEYLTTPKAEVRFHAPARPLDARRFAARLRRSGAALDARTQLLYRGTRFFLNGESLEVGPRSRRALAALADTRRIEGASLDAPGLATLLHEWYRQGVLHLSDSA